MSNETGATVSEVSVEKKATLMEKDGDLRYELEEDVEVTNTSRPPKVPPPGWVDPTPANVMTVAVSPAFATSALYQSLANTTGLAFGNAASAQQQLALASHASMVAAVARLSGFASTAMAAAKQAGLPAPSGARLRKPQQRRR